MSVGRTKRGAMSGQHAPNVGLVLSHEPGPPRASFDAPSISADYESRQSQTEAKSRKEGHV